MNNWLDKFRDDRRDPNDPRWLDKFRDDPNLKNPRVAREGRPKPPPPPAPQGRPQEILLFAALMAFSLTLGLTATAIAFPRLAEIASPLEILLPDILVIVVMGAFVYLAAGLRQFWAVWVLVAFCAVRFLLYVPTFFHIESVSVRLLTAVYFILQAAAFWFAFTPESRRWFRKANK